MIQYLFASLKAKISIFVFHGDFPYNIIHCHEVKADPNNLLKLKALYQALFAWQAQFWMSSGGNGFLTTDQLQEYLEKYFSSEENFLCPFHCWQRQNSSFWYSKKSYCHLVWRKASLRIRDKASMVVCKCKRFFISLYSNEWWERGFRAQQHTARMIFYRDHILRLWCAL